MQGLNFHHDEVAPVQLLGDALLLAGLHGVELLAQVAVQHVLAGVVGGAITQVVPGGQGSGGQVARCQVARWSIDKVNSSSVDQISGG